MREDLEEQTQIILSALSAGMDSMKKGIDSRFDAVGNRMDEIETNLGGKIDELQTSVDGFAKRQSDFEEENVIIKEEIKQMKSAFKEKLGVEISAI